MPGFVVPQLKPAGGRGGAFGDSFCTNRRPLCLLGKHCSTGCPVLGGHSAAGMSQRGLSAPVPGLRSISRLLPSAPPAAAAAAAVPAAPCCNRACRLAHSEWRRAPNMAPRVGAGGGRFCRHLPACPLPLPAPHPRTLPPPRPLAEALPPSWDAEINTALFN